MEERFAVVPGMTMIKANGSYSGSHSGMQWKIRVSQDSLDALCWPLPWCLEKTPEDQVQHAVFPFSESGLRDAERWIETQYHERSDFWEGKRNLSLF